MTELGLGSDAGGNDTVVVADSYAKSLASALPGTGGHATFVLGRPDVSHFPTDVAGFRQQIDPDIENIRLEGNAAHDIVADDHGSLIVGNDGANHVYAGGGDDAIYGSGGNDFIDAGDGNDWLDGGLGDDTLYGGGGDDVFVLGLQESGDRRLRSRGPQHAADRRCRPGPALARLRGDDLLVTHDGTLLATVKDYAGHADNIAGVDLGQGVRPVSDFMASRMRPRRASRATGWPTTCHRRRARRAVARALGRARSGRPHDGTGRGRAAACGRHRGDAPFSRPATARSRPTSRRRSLAAAGRSVGRRHDAAAQRRGRPSGTTKAQPTANASFPAPTGPGRCAGPTFFARAGGGAPVGLGSFDASSTAPVAEKKRGRRWCDGVR